MAVYQISRIQIRRGQANQGTGLPQLASGEMAWAIDTQELYIGNGSVSEGAPAVGNTKILTSNDLSSQAGLVNTIFYTYKVLDTSIVTGVSVNTPVSRSLQSRLDDTVNLSDFLTTEDVVRNDYTTVIQRAINQLFLNAGHGNAYSTVGNRIKLTLPAGTFNISSTLYIPSYVTLEGAGVDKTIINYNPSSSVSGSTTNNSRIISTNTATLAMLGAKISGTNIPANTSIPGRIEIPNSTIFGTTLTVGTLISGTITTGMMLYGPGINPNTFIVANLSGNGSGSTWTVNQNYSVTTPAGQQVTGTGVVISSVFTGSIVVGTGLYLGSGVLTTTNIASGTIQIGQLITGTGIAAGTYITGNISATSWTVNISQATPSTTITGNGFISITSAATATGSNITFTLVKGQPAIQFVNDSSTPGNPSQLSLTTSGTQPRYISMSNMTIQTATGSNTCLQLDAVRNSVFENLKLTGGNNGYISTFNTSSAGMTLNALSSLVTCKDNAFKNIEFSTFTFGVYSYQDILNNVFENCNISNVYQGFALGYVYFNQYTNTDYYISNYTVQGQNFGPRQTQINNCKFYNVYRQAVFLGLGSGNTVESPKLVLVGNNGGNETLPTSTQLYFKSSGNSIENMYSDRAVALASNTNIASPYIPEAAGWVEHKSFGIANKISIAYTSATTAVGQLALGQLYTIAALGTTNNVQWNTIAGTVSQPYTVGSTFRCAVIGAGLGNGTVVTPTFLFRLPVSTDESGNPNGSAVYIVEYTYVSTQFNFVRRGTMTISADVHNIGGVSYVYPLQLSDEYDFAGTEANSLQLDFSAVYLDASGGIYDPTDSTPPSSIQVQYNNLLSSDAGSFTYLYSVTYTQPY
jgi:Major tropism determinant N-terminal domain